MVRVTIINPNFVISEVVIILLPNNILLDKSKIVSRPKTLKKEWYKE